jgi:Na+/melibiose symporter-like transporter
MIEHLRATKPWVRFLSIMGFIGSGLMLLAGLVMPVLGTLNDELGGWASAGFGILYVAFAVVYVFPSLFLWRYASAIGVLVSTRGIREMELALSHQKSFWRFFGIMSLVMVCLYALGMLVALCVVAIVALGALR